LAVPKAFKTFQGRQLAEAQKPAAKPKAPTVGSVPLGAKPNLPKPEADLDDFIHCAAGNCDKLEKMGVNVDGWGHSKETLRRIIPNFALDASAEGKVIRAQSSREGRFARYNHANDTGVYTEKVRWGARANLRFWSKDESPGAKKLEKRGVLVNGFQSGNRLTALAKEGDVASLAPLESKGVKLASYNLTEQRGVTCDGPNLPDCHATVDGAVDRLVAIQHVPKHRKEGLAPQERPAYFLLDPEASWDAAQPATEANGLEPTRPVSPAPAAAKGAKPPTQWNWGKDDA